MNRYVIDSSAVGPLVLEDEAEPHAPTILSLLTNAELFVPPHWFFEVSNMLLVAMRRGRLTDAARTGALRRIADLDVEMDLPSLDHAWADSFDLAVADGLTLYDAAYLELARRRGYGLLTLDGALARAARERGLGTPLLP